MNRQGDKEIGRPGEEEREAGKTEDGRRKTEESAIQNSGVYPTPNTQHPTPNALPCVILAGGKAKPELQALTGQSNRALVMVNGKSLLRHVVDALRAAGENDTPLGPVAVVGDLPGSDDYASVPDAGDFVANVFAGLAQFPDAPYVLITTCDLPFLTADSVRNFARAALAQANEHQSDICYPIVPVQLCYDRFPGVKRTALKLREGHFTGGNLALARPGFLHTHKGRIAAAYAARKSPLKLAAMLGFGTVGRLVLSQKLRPNLLTIALLEARVGRLLGGKAAAILSHDPELATDLDRPSDFKAVT